MEKLQALLTLHKDKLEELGLTGLVIDPKARECAQAILLDGYTDGEPNGLAMSFCDLLFNTPFLSWLEWNGPELGTDWIHFIDGDYSTEPKQSDYHKINLVLLNSDEDMVLYIEQHTI